MSIMPQQNSLENSYPDLQLQFIERVDFGQESGEQGREGRRFHPVVHDHMSPHMCPHSGRVNRKGGNLVLGP